MFFSETEPISDCHNIEVTRRKKYFVSSWAELQCITNGGPAAFKFNAAKSLNIEAKLTLISSNTGTSGGGAIVVNLQSTAVNESISISSEKVQVDKTIASNQAMLAIPAGAMVLIAIQGNSTFDFSFSHLLKISCGSSAFSA